MSTGLKVAMVAIVILIVALVVIGIFMGGMDGIKKQVDEFFDWMNQQNLEDLETKTCSETKPCGLGLVCSSEGKCVEQAKG